MKFIKKTLLSWLDAVPRKELEAKVSECESLQSNLEHYEQFAEQCYWYIGTYPAWKAQSEFRELLVELGCPLDPKNGSRAADVDFYLGKVVDACADIRTKAHRANFDDEAEHWLGTQLSEARGDNWLVKPVTKAG
ncbi:hypothetical protein [Idiomarina sp. UBA1919]|uniref:hypothetical protein n=1 Tax=Idiomarina sp. UBA1919 TaxID=1946640 RepID=UPI00257DFC19|nr:hypothetical protein [Idiomarina sp. UBA1919]|tara:strand:- start:2248 stop:2652 length:405 start_codon:yes stop_codon:yes gene_type:complete